MVTQFIWLVLSYTYSYSGQNEKPTEQCCETDDNTSCALLRDSLTLCILINFPIHIDTILPNGILYLKGSAISS